MSLIPEDIQQQLSNINGSASSVRMAIMAKGVTPAGGMPTYAAAIGAIQGTRSIGEIVTSILPLTDAGLHLLDGALIQRGVYTDFVNYVADLYENNDKYSNTNTIGSLTDNSGVISGFSTSNYMTLPLPFVPNLNTWEIVFKITTGADVNTQQFISSAAPPLGVGALDVVISEGFFSVNISSQGINSWDITYHHAGTYTVLANTTYWVKIEFTGTQYILSYSLDGETYTADITEASSTPVYQGTIFMLGVDYTGSILELPFLGSIDLNGCYINVDNTRVWTGRLPVGFVDEGQWQSTVTAYDACGKFVYDSINNTVRLPKVEHFVECSTDPNELGKITEAGLPNITGHVTREMKSSNTDKSEIEWIGALGYQTFNQGSYGGNTTQYRTANIYLDASRSNPLYGNSVTVQPQSVKILYYVVIATQTKTSIEVDIDEIVTDLNSKVSADLIEVNNTGTSTGASWVMPSAEYINLTLGASGTEYTAPANGWFAFGKRASGVGQYFNIIYRRPVEIPFWSDVSSGASGNILGHLVPVKKGQVIMVSYTTGGDTTVSRFIYAEGSKHEA